MRWTSCLKLTAAALIAAGAAGAQSLDPAKVTQPDGIELAEGDPQTLRARGEGLFNDPSIGESGLSCANCHADFGQYKQTFKKPYPHFVNMAKAKAGLDAVNAAEMVQLCMLVPMQTEPLDWRSAELAALAAYVEQQRAAFAAKSGE
jgi:cytochrome c